MGKLYGIVQAHLDRYGVREAAFARKIDSAPQTVNSWKTRGIKSLPEKRLLQAVARETDTDYLTVLVAALLDADYLPELPAVPGGSDGHGEQSAPIDEVIAEEFKLRARGRVKRGRGGRTP